MRTFTRPALLNLAYYSGAALCWLAAAALLALGLAAAAMWCAAAASAWIIGALGLMLLFEPALNRWCDGERRPTAEQLRELLVAPAE